MHAGAVTIGPADAGHVNTVIDQRHAVAIIKMESTVEVKTISGLNPLSMRIGIGAIALGYHIHQFAVTGKFRVLVHRGIEDAHLLPFTGITRGIGLIGVNSPQPPVGIEFITAPA
ncbi:Uncharacterised protein [Serratia proteamaculans]|nr:Uncharacterised protein [Serratia proteamaculans]